MVAEQISELLMSLVSTFQRLQIANEFNKTERSALKIMFIWANIATLETALAAQTLRPFSSFL